MKKTIVFKDLEKKYTDARIFMLGSVIRKIYFEDGTYTDYERAYEEIFSPNYNEKEVSKKFDISINKFKDNGALSLHNVLSEASYYDSFFLKKDIPFALSDKKSHELFLGMMLTLVRLDFISLPNSKKFWSELKTNTEKHRAFISMIEVSYNEDGSPKNDEFSAVSDIDPSLWFDFTGDEYRDWSYAED